MFNHLYQYIFSPKQTIKLYNHTKNWPLWWIITGLSGLLSSIKLSNIGITSLFAHTTLYLFILIILSIIIDFSAQLIGSKSQLMSILYWGTFANTILWLSPSVKNIQSILFSIGPLLLLALNIIYIIYLWKTLSSIYNFKTKKMILLIVIPIGFLLLLTISMIIFGFQTLFLLS